MMLNGGTLDGRRYLSPTTVKLMTSDHLGNRAGLPFTPGTLLMGVDGYTFGLGFMVRQGPGLAGVPGSEGEYMWAGRWNNSSGSIPRSNLPSSTWRRHRAGFARTTAA
jgi:CubicO group peptidase (beta-lactamase class C family)